MQPQMQIEALALAPGWHLARRMAFRFTFAYFLLYNLPFPLGVLPFTASPAQWYESLWQAIVPWAGKHLLRLTNPITIFSNGSGDTTYDYVKVLCFLTLAAGATGVWSLLDRKRRNYEQLHQWLRILIRFVLAAAMIGYGAYKAIKSQFPDPSLDRLLQPIGDASPMGLLWTFMGASTPYNVFAGLAEMLGGVLLVWRRTTTLGGLVCIGVLANVFMLNMSYDVPVKLYSFHLLVMAVFLTVPDLRRLADLLLFNRRVEPVAFSPLFTRKWLNRAALILPPVVGLYLVGSALFDSYGVYKVDTDPAKKSPLRGIWFVDEFTVNGEVRPPLVTDDMRWQRVVFDYSERLGIQFMSGSRQPFLQQLDGEKQTLTLGKRDDPDWKAEFAVATLEPNLMRLEGQFNGLQIRARLRRTDESQFRLTNRGFHWINEYPFNR